MTTEKDTPNPSTEKEGAREHDEGCDGVQRYSDGIFNSCLCKARLLNTFAGARYKLPGEAKATTASRGE